MLAYASPPGFTPGGQWQDGSVLVMHKEATFLDCCVKCGQPSDGKIWKHTYWWHHPAYALLIFAGILVYAIVAMIVRQPATVKLYLCEQHRSRRRWGMLITWLLSLATLGLFIGGAAYAANARSSDGWIGGVIALGGFVTLIAAVIVGTVVAPILKPKKIDKEYAWFKGASREYLAQLPTVVT
ncbi:hypothetical protein BH09PLA1_BH09PLA1_24210 [soil metagenome]